MTDLYKRRPKSPVLVHCRSIRLSGREDPISTAKELYIKFNLKESISEVAREAVPLTSCPGEGLPNAESGNRLCWSPPGRSLTPNPAALGSLQPVPTQCTNSVIEIKFVANGE